MGCGCGPAAATRPYQASEDAADVDVFGCAATGHAGGADGQGAKSEGWSGPENALASLQMLVLPLMPP